MMHIGFDVSLQYALPVIVVALHVAYRLGRFVERRGLAVVCVRKGDVQ